MTEKKKVLKTQSENQFNTGFLLLSYLNIIKIYMLK